MADSHFRKEFREHFIERFWEMYLAVAFIEHGLHVEPGTGSGPDFSFIDDGRRFWVEAVAPGPGTGADRVPETKRSVAYTVPTEKILLRFSSVVVAKSQKYQDALNSGKISKDDGYILAINSRGIPHAPYGNTLPFYVQALLPFGNRTFVFDRSTGVVKDRFYQERETVQKENESPVSMRPFLDREFAFVSAVLHSAVDCVNRPNAIGADFSLLRNPLATCPLQPQTFGWCEQYSYRNGELCEEPVRGKANSHR